MSVTSFMYFISFLFPLLTSHFHLMDKEKGIYKGKNAWKYMAEGQ